MKEFHDYSLLPHNTFGIDARCSHFMEYETVDDALRVASLLRDGGDSKYIIIGGGSNLLLTADFDGLVIRSGIKGIRQTGADTVESGSGECWDGLVDWLISHGLYGAENLSLIPGDVGAAAVQNIGAYGAEVCNIISHVEAVDISSSRLCRLTAAECSYGYRSSRFKHEWHGKYLITGVTFRLSTTFRPLLDYGNIRDELRAQGTGTPSARQLRDAIINIRNRKLPDYHEKGNAGSFFMNPVVSTDKYLDLRRQYPDMPHYTVSDSQEKIPAGWLIEQCGWKGKSLGRAGVHDKQALILVNLGGATGREIVELCHAVQSDVSSKFSILLTPEVNII